MARRILLFVLISSVLALAGCDTGGGPTISPTTTSAPTSTSAPSSTAEPTSTTPAEATATTGTTGEGIDITSTVLARGVSNNVPVDPTTEFAPGDTFFLIVELDDPPSGTRVKADWSAVDAGGETNVKIGDKELTITGNTNIVNFSLALPRPWPVGIYKVDLYINDTLSRTLEFTVKVGGTSSSAPTPTSTTGSTGSNAEITSAVMATDFVNNEAVGITTTFP